eukprot:TRINITY_DN25013_c0_g1_i1.p1 TRINITY_DN25013_c0_g1~~TRINITY_DN25013_c0_g1_i1.p1  ORF type:complete len:706 (-),score=134.30 TRINITY_DN25013_c0_g1_i1:31-2067(-)
MALWRASSVSSGSLEVQGNWESHILTQAEMFTPFRCFIVLVVLEVIRKQRRDMTQLVNIIRHRLFVDEALRGEVAEVSFGPVSARTVSEEESFSDALWLLSEWPSTDDDESEESEKSKMTLIDAHKRCIQKQIAQLRVGTGAIAEMADAEATMFLESTTRDMLEQRLDTLEDTQAMMEALMTGSPNSRHVKMDFNQLVQVLGAGYYKHFAEDATRDYYEPSWKIFVASLVQALLPTAIAAFTGTLMVRLPFTEASKNIPGVPILTILTGIVSFLNLYSMLRSIGTVTQDLTKASECFIILQRIASTHHRRRANFKCQSQREKQMGSTEFDRSRDASPLRGIFMEDQQFSEILDSRNKVRFKASAMKGADCHVNVRYMHKFDNIMRRRYGCTTSTPPTATFGRPAVSPPTSPIALNRRHSITSTGSAKGCESALGDGHLHSFFELDIHSQAPLRMWWVMRQYVESGLLKDKVVLELLVGFTVFVLVLSILLASSWLLLVGKINTSIVVTVWEIVCLSMAVLRVLRLCSRVNQLLAFDSKRLAFVQHDVCEEVAAAERKRRAAMVAHGGAISHTYSSLSDASVGRVSPETDGTTVVMGDCGGVPVAEDPHFGLRSTIQLLTILVARLDRDFRPMRLIGFVIDEQFLRRFYMIAFSFCSTGIVHGFAKVCGYASGDIPDKQ